MPYTAKLRDEAPVNVVQTNAAENDSAAPRFADNFDAYAWLFAAELTTWQHITVHHSTTILTCPRPSSYAGHTAVHGSLVFAGKPESYPRSATTRPKGLPSSSHHFHGR
ncbi:hypothetical protein [Mycobacterium colombiense]|uniref:hypothetical protein n=1 Tax=Mycobacterium colombiense TaxID=339268 RepID=UPI000A83486B|nr:hypothetical protein [Mycobacterium colombiense]